MLRPLRKTQSRQSGTTLVSPSVPAAVMRRGRGRSLRRQRRCRSDRRLTRRGRSRLRFAGTGSKQQGDYRKCRANQDSVFHSWIIVTQQFVTRRAARRIKSPKFLHRDPGPLLFELGASAFRFQNLAFERSRSRRSSASFPFAPRNFRRALLHSILLNGVQQAFARELAIHGLGARILHRNANTGWPMTKRHCSGNLVGVLSPGAARSRKCFFDVRRAYAKPSHPSFNLIHTIENASRIPAMRGAAADKQKCRDATPSLR